MRGKTLVISGGTRGIGKAIVYEFAREGVNVAFTYNSNEALAQEQVADLEKNYGINYNGFFTTFGIGLEYFFKGNDSENTEQHIDFNNKLRFGYEF